jgi:isoleucyl-tRNA synthetase
VVYDTLALMKLSFVIIHKKLFFLFLGNVVAPSQITKGKNPKGVDVLRYWVGAHASQSPAIQISDNVMESSKQEVDKIRNSLRFIISNLHEENSELLDLKVSTYFKRGFDFLF